MRAAFRPLLLSLALLAPAVQAQTVTDLYQVREAVASQQPEERSAALTRALDTLLVRLTGSEAAVQNPALAELRKDPQQLISRYGYEADSLLVQFDPVTTDAALQRAGLPLWGASRPELLVWWLSEGNTGTHLAGDGQDSAVLLGRAAQHRGLPLRLPLADLDEQLVGTAENIASADPAALRQASERYGSDALLAVHARDADGQWQAHWNLWLGEVFDQGSVSAPDEAQLADAVMLAVSERLAPRFVAAPGAARGLTIEVAGASLQRYAELQRLLDPLGGRLLKAQGDRLTYQVNASPEQLRAQLGLANLREEVAATEGAAAEGGQPAVPAASSERLYFRW